MYTVYIHDVTVVVSGMKRIYWQITNGGVSTPHFGRVELVKKTFDLFWLFVVCNVC